jgi:hypothetical protein
MADNNILTEAEVARFINAVCELRGEDPAPINPAGLCDSDVVDTRESASDYIARYGQPDDTNEIDGLTIMVWRGVQPHKGAQRRDLTLAEFAADRLAIIAE